MEYIKKIVAVIALTLVGCQPPVILTMPKEEKESHVEMIIVSQDWCVPCKLLKGKVSAMKEDGELSDVKIRVLDGPNEEYGADAFPTTYVCKGDTCRGPFVGNLSREKIREITRW